MIKDLVRKNRSYRGYDESRKITEDELKELVDTARVAGSAANLQPLKYRLVCSESEVAKLNGITRWGKMLKDIELPHTGKYPTAYIVICVDTEITKAPENANTDIGIAAQTIRLAAVEQGLGGCMIGNYEKA
ncbi:MAG: nitroreductase family protein, partial [Lachnospiraceae bacterium]|nr:nitroreductase family protein [Lachnospiraceae bacterium]